MNPTNEKRRIAVNAMSNFAGFTTRVIVVFFVSPIVVHALGDERYGIWQLVDSVLAYMAMADLGIGAAVLRYVARFDGLKDEEEINRVFSCSAVLFGLIGLLLLAATATLMTFSGQLFGLDGDLAIAAKWLLVLLGINLAMGLPLGLFRSVLAGLGRYPTINAVTIAGMLIRNALFVLVVRMNGGLLAIGIVITVCSVLQHLVYAILALRHLPTLRFSLHYLEKKTFREIGGYSTGVFTSLTAGRIAKASEAIIVGAALGPVSVTYYAIAAYIPRDASHAVRTMLAVLTPSFSRLDARGKFSEIQDITISVSTYVLFLALPITAGVLLFGESFLRLWMGEPYAQRGTIPIMILAASMPLCLLQTLALRVLHGLGRVRFVALCTIARAGAAIALGVVLTYRFGISGMAFAVSLPEAVMSCVILTYTCRVIGASVARLLGQAIVRPAFAVAPAVVVWQLALNWIPIDSWRVFFGTLLIGLLPYCLVVVILDNSTRHFVCRAILMVGERLLKRRRITMLNCQDEYGDSTCAVTSKLSER